MQSIQNTVIGGLEYIKDKLEQTDESVVNRDKVFAASDANGAAEATRPPQRESANQE